jgi:spectinomycin phosphotransferase
MHEQIINCLRAEYGLGVEAICLLSLGADVTTSVYRVITENGTNYFVKLRKGDFNEGSVTIPSFLSTLGIKQIIPPLATRTGHLWTNIDSFKLILYPFVEGHAGLERKMFKRQWLEFGKALKRVHTVDLPLNLTSNLRKEDFSSRWRNTIKLYLEHLEKEVFHGSIEEEAAGLLKSKKDQILDVIKRTEQLAQMLQERPCEFVLSHGDIHGWNLLIDTHGALYIVDWDALCFAPKERDLMFIGGGHGDSGYTPQEEEAMFYQGYGQTNINPIALTYYRYERILVDIADDCNLIFWSDEGQEFKTAALEDLKNKFLPACYLDIAYRSDTISKIV